MTVISINSSWTKSDYHYEYLSAIMLSAISVRKHVNINFWHKYYKYVYTFALLINTINHNS